MASHSVETCGTAAYNLLQLRHNCHRKSLQQSPCFSFESIQFIRLFVWPSFELKFARNRSVVVASSAGRHFPVKSIRESSRISWNPFRCPSFRLHHKVAGLFLDKVLFFHFSNFSKCWLFNRLSSRKQKNVRKIRAALRRAVPQRLSFQNQLNR